MAKADLVCLIIGGAPPFPFLCGGLGPILGKACPASQPQEESNVVTTAGQSDRDS